MTLKLMSVVGARPQFIKSAPVSRHFSRITEIDEILVHTGQHYDYLMSQVFFDELNLSPPALNLGIGSGPQGDQTGRMLSALERAMLETTPDAVLVYGDTNSTLAACLAASKLHIPVAHVEAGLRSYNRLMPEEINRIVADQVSDLLFAPSAAAVNNLLGEGRPSEIIFETGDVMYDLALETAGIASERSDVLARMGLEPDGYAVATVHRAENVKHPQRLAAIINGLGSVETNLKIVLPLHPNTRLKIKEQGLESRAGLIFTDPISYLDMTALVAASRLVATDSGGLQKEAFYHKVPCLTLRDETEWVELVELGWNRLVPPVDAEAVRGELESQLCMPRPEYPTVNPYGDGQAARHIAEALLS